MWWFHGIYLIALLALILGEKGRRIRELTSVVQKRFNFPENSVELYAEKVNNRGLCAIAQAESLRYKLLGGLAVRRYSFYLLLLQKVWFLGLFIIGANFSVYVIVCRCIMICNKLIMMRNVEPVQCLPFFVSLIRSIWKFLSVIC